MTPSRSAARGFTMLEVAVVTVVFALIVSAFGRTFTTTSGLAATSRAALLANDDERRSLDAISGVLRGADYLSLTGFDEAGVATSLGFCRALGADASGIVLDVPESLAWRSVSQKYSGISAPGEVVLTKNGVGTVLAPRVPSGGFMVTRVGNTLRITLTTFSSKSQRTLATSTCTTYVSLRN